METEMKRNRIPEMFGCEVFSESVMKERLPEDVFAHLMQTREEGKHLDPAIAGAVASAMKDWAIEKGATHYTHWFQPLTGITAEKHDSFISPDGKDQIVLEFSGKELVKGEPDASSFPNGGLRSTFEARGYTAWDPSAYAFIKDNTLCIPTVFYSYGGEALDKKTPLLRSVEAINKQGLRVLRLLGNTEAKRIVIGVGAEQEYFLISRKKYYQREDLVICGRTLFGARPSKGQEMEDHYFGTIKPRVAEFMADLDEELWKLGILAKTEHNEVAPAQHELAPIYSEVNKATDDNQLTMEIMKKVARRHDLACLLHEKPFEGINGSGKHNNWSIATDTGENLLDPGDTPSENARFLVFLCAVIQAVDTYNDLLRVSASGPNNDHRLGGDEAPPAIVSMFLGTELTEILETIGRGESYQQKDHRIIKGGVHILPRFRQDGTDRNRTSPFAFTGNKFEFRMPGSGQSIAGPNVIMNTIVADSLEKFADELEKAPKQELDQVLYELIRRVIKEHSRIIFNGNNYSEEWRNEAQKRGLCNAPTTVDALEAYRKEKNVELFTHHKVYNKTELKSRFDISMESYSKTLHMEAMTMVDMLYKQILPAVTKYEKELLQTAAYKKDLGLCTGQEACCSEQQQAAKLSELSARCYQSVQKLEDDIQKAGALVDVVENAKFYRDVIVADMQAVRKPADEMERLTAEEFWPYPTYTKLLFYV